MNTTISEIKLLISFILFGIFLLSIHDIYRRLVKPFTHKKKILDIILQLIGASLVVILSYRYAHSINNGDIPLYFILFLFIGFFLYWFVIKPSFLDSLDMIYSIIKWSIKPIKKILRFLIIPIEVIKGCKKVLARGFLTVKNFFHHSNS